jgi:putative transposase
LPPKSPVCFREVTFPEVDYRRVSSFYYPKTGLHDYFQLYNYERPHQSLDYLTPAMVHFDTQGDQ